jgi:hypothetical protein
MKEKIFNIIQIGDKSNRMFDIFIPLQSWDVLWQSDNCFPGAEGGFVDSSPEGYHIADERYYGHPGGK